METRVLIKSVRKPYAAFPPPPVMIHIKFDQDWATGFRDIQVWKCGRQTDDGQTDDVPLVYYKLTLWAFGSGELKMGVMSKVLQWPWKLGQGHQKRISSSSCPNVISMQIWLKSANQFMRHRTDKKLSHRRWHQQIRTKNNVPLPFGGGHKY